MDTLVPYFILSLIPIVLILFIFYSNSKEKRKRRELKLRVVKFAIQCVIIVIFAILLVFFIINLEIFTAEPSSSILEIVFIGGSQLSLVISSILFLYTFKSPKIFELIMEYPSKSESKIGNFWLCAGLTLGLNTSGFFDKKNRELENNLIMTTLKDFLLRIMQAHLGTK